MQIERIYAFMLEKHKNLRGWFNRDYPKPNSTIDVPVLAFLIQYSGGNILYDTGSSRAVRDTPAKYMERLGADIKISVDQTRNILGYLNEVKVEELSHLVIGHGHFDHAGYAAELKQKYPKAAIVLHGEELKAMEKPGKQKDVYFKEEFKWVKEASPIYEDVSLTPDSKIQTCHLPGHTPGQIGLILHEPGLILVGDSIFTRENLKGHLPDDKMVWDEEKYNATIIKLKEMQKLGYGITMSHDARFLSNEKGFLKLFRGKGEFVKKEKLYYMVVDYN